MEFIVSDTCGADFPKMIVERHLVMFSWIFYRACTPIDQTIYPLGDAPNYATLNRFIKKAARQTFKNYEFSLIGRLILLNGTAISQTRAHMRKWSKYLATPKTAPLIPIKLGEVKVASKMAK